MQVEEIKNEALEKHIRITIPVNDIDKKFQEKLSEIQGMARIPGYRPGKVPSWLVLKQFGASIYEEIVRDAIEESAKEITKDLSLVNTPDLDNLEKEKGKDVSFVLKFEVLPEIQIPDLQNISIEKPTFTISEEEIKEDLDKILEDATIYEVKEGKATKKDAVVIDIKGKTSDGDAFPKQEIKEMLLKLKDDSLLSKRFNDELSGKKANDEMEIVVDYAADFNNSLIAGKTVTYNVKVNEVRSAKAAELDDELAKSRGYSSLEDLKKDLISKKEESYKEQVHTLLSMRLFDQLENLLTFDIPKSILEQEVKNIATEMGSLKDEDETLKDKTEEELQEYAKRFATRRVRIGMMLSEYAKNKGVKINAEDIQKAVLRRVRMFPGYLQQEMLNWYYKDQKNLNSVSGAALEQKVVENILNKDLKIVEKSYSIKELIKLIDKETENKLY
jgi:trigger factor